MEPAPHIQDLATFAMGLRVRDLPDAVTDRVRWILADCVGCIVAGHRAAEMTKLASLRGAESGDAATLLGTARGAPRETAALLNGMAGTWHDLDEGNLHTKGHAGIQIVPALLAEAEVRRAPGAAVVAALAAGYEVGCRIYGGTQARLAVHPHGTFGPMAAAVAVGHLRGLTAARLANVMRLAAGLALAASRATLAEGATLRNAYTGTSGPSAFLALDLEAAGFEGESDPLATVFGQILGTSYDPAASTAGLGTSWRLLRNYFKNHPSARYAHSALDLLDDIVAAHGPIDPAAVTEISIDTYALAATLAGQRVTSAFGTRFSIPFLLAARMLGAEEALDGDGSQVLSRVEVHALAARVYVTESAADTAAYPAQQRSRMAITLRDGQVLRAAADFIRGEAERPHSEAALRHKFMALTEPSWGLGAADMLAGLLAPEQLPDMAAWAASGRHLSQPSMANAVGDDG